MMTIEQLPQKIDSNVTVTPPAKIEIKYQVNCGWFIKLDGSFVTTIVNEPRYWSDVAEPLQWLIERHLVVTKAYQKLEKAVKKVHNKSYSKEIEQNHE